MKTSLRLMTIMVFITRRRGYMVERLNSLLKTGGKPHIERAGNKKATVKVIDEVIFLKDIIKMKYALSGMVK